MEHHQPERAEPVGRGPVLRVRLLGGLDLRRGDRPLAPPEPPRARALLAMLALRGGSPQPRGPVAFRLWPDSSEPQARTNLRHVLHDLRRERPDLAALVAVTPRALAWRPDGPWSLDVAEFEAALDRAGRAGVDPGLALGALAEAVSLYAGDLLEGWDDEWLEEERRRLRDRHLDALWSAACLSADRGRHAEAVQHLRALLAREPLREDAGRLLMRVHEMAGDRAAAARAYRDLAGALRRELGVEPSATTRAAYAALVRAAAPREGAGLAGDAPARAEVVGRDPEWRRLTAQWRRAERGEPRLVLLTGEPGIGKTRLAEELAAWCAHRGALVAQARAYPAEGDLGYGVVTAWLGAPELGPAIEGAPAADRATLARILPEAAGDPAPSPAAARERRRRLFEAATGALAGAGPPTLLVADDAQWCDAESLQLIDYAVRRHAGRPFLILATARREDLEEDHPLAALVHELGAVERAEEIVLARLGPAETAELGGLLAGAPLDDAAAAALYAETEGNPLFVVESLRAGTAGTGAGGLSPRLHSLIAARLRSLSPGARSLAGVAAAVGRTLTAELLRAATGRSETDLAAALDELWRRGVLREHGPGEYDFTHGRIRDVAYEDLAPGTRRRHHLALAEALQRVHRADPEPASGRVAWHYDRAGRVADALAWYRRAAAQARRRGADAEAVRLLERALALLPEGADATAPRLELELLSSLAIPLAVAEGFGSDRLEVVQRRAIAASRAAGVEPSPELLRSLAMTSLCRSDFGRARALAGRLRDAATGAHDEDLLVEGEYLLGVAAFWAGAPAAARHHLRRAIAGSRPERRSAHLSRFGHDPAAVCLSRLGNALFLLGRPGDARRARAEALAVADAGGHPYSRGAAYAFGAMLAVDLGEHRDLPRYVRALDDSNAHGSATELGAEALRGLVAVLEGDAGEGMERVRAALEASGSVDAMPGLRAVLTRLLLAACEATGDAEGGLAAADAALALATPVWEAEARRLRAEFLAATGATPREVAGELARAASVARRQGAAGLLRRVERSRRRMGVRDGNAPGTVAGA